MKKVFIVVLIFIGFQSLIAQNEYEDLRSRKYEVKMNVTDFLLLGKLNLEGEYFIDDDFSLILNTQVNLYKDSFELDDDGDNRVSTFQILPTVRYSLSKKIHSFFYLESYLNMNWGKYKKIKRLDDNLGNGYYRIVDEGFSDLALGFGLGYKFYIKKRLGIDFNFGVAGNLFNDNSVKEIYKGGVVIGYRF
ncbi:MAG: DUF3575 domain-containing protein [Flavobacteriales bacterium]|nr:DUF3575 domain-containing protein [Flavobacteriales bacterium]